MSHHKRTKKDVEEAYRRGFQDGFNVRPAPLTMILRSIWRKHEMRKAKRAFLESVKNHKIQSQSIGFVKRFEEDENGITAEIILERPNA